MRLRSKFASTCGACGDSITVGAEVEWEPGKKAVHAKCPPAPLVLPAKFVVALGQVERERAATVPQGVVPAARDHFVSLVSQHGVRPVTLAIPEGGEEIVLSVGPENRVMERALVWPSRMVFYLRYNGGALVDRTVNNVEGHDEIGWSLKWSAPVDMAVQGLRLGVA